MLPSDKIPFDKKGRSDTTSFFNHHSVGDGNVFVSFQIGKPYFRTISGESGGSLHADGGKRAELLCRHYECGLSRVDFNPLGGPSQVKAGISGSSAP